MKTKTLMFLDLEEVLFIHEDQIRHYGGRPGVRDEALLASAVAMPQASFGGGFLHQDVFEMAAAYAFHICQNHPFIDGNKRAALASALVFLDLNGIDVQDPEGRLYPAMMEMASGQTGKAEFTEVLRNLATTTPGIDD
jgi:death on curing protein